MIEPENWGGTETQHWEICRSRDALADIVTIGFGFLSDSQCKTLHNAYNQLSLTHPSVRSKLLVDFETRRWLTRIQSQLAQGVLPYVESSAESAPEFGFVNLLALTSAMIDRQEYRCEIWHSGGRLRLPSLGSRLYLSPGDSPNVSLETDKNGKIRCSFREIPILPAKRVSGFEILLADGEVNLPLEGGYEALTEAEADWAKWEGLMEGVAALLRLHASAESLVGKLVQGVVPLRPSLTGSHLSSSFRELPGVVSLAFSNEIDVAEALVHEADHQRFYTQTTVEPVWENDQATPAIYRSPWRPDPRPLDGLLAGASALSTVANFWARVVTVVPTQLKTLMRLDCDHLGYRATHAMLQVDEALGVIQRHGRLTPSGCRFLSVVAERNYQARQELETHLGFKSWQEDGLLRCETHRLEWAHRHSCTGEILSSSSSLRRELRA